MFILNLANATAQKTYMDAVKGVLVHVSKRAQLDQLDAAALLKIHNGLVPDTEALSADSAPGKVATSLWEVLTTNQEVFAVEAPKKSTAKSTAEKVKAERKTHGQTATQSRKEGKTMKQVKTGRANGNEETVVKALRKSTEKDGLAPQAAAIMTILNAHKAGLTRVELGKLLEKAVKPSQAGVRIYAFYRPRLVHAKLVAEVK